jgi:general secretion pathway protein D
VGSFVPGQGGGSLQATTFSILSNTKALQLFFNAEENSSRVRTLSSPSILVTDNTTARVQVGASVPIPTSSGTPVTSSNTSLYVQTIQYLETGVILSVNPRINAGGIVSMTITQEVSAAAANTVANIEAPIINKNSFQTSVVLKDGQTLALGGIIETSVSYSKERIPLLGDIPVVGLLFGNTTRSTSRKELILMLTPHVIEDFDQGSEISQEFLQKLREVQKAVKELK